MTKLNLRTMQRILKEQVPAGSVALLANIDSSGVGEMVVPFRRGANG